MIKPSIKRNIIGHSCRSEMSVRINPPTLSIVIIDVKSKVASTVYEIPGISAITNPLLSRERSPPPPCGEGFDKYGGSHTPRLGTTVVKG